MTHLGIGMVEITTGTGKIWTVLGSCVAIVFFNPRTKTGAICHAQLPERNPHSNKCSDSCTNPCFDDQPEDNEYKYVSCCFNYMLKTFNGKGIRNNEILCGIYGGSSIFGHYSENGTIGSNNTDIARKLIKKHKIKLFNDQTEGNQGRKIIFDAQTGEVEVRLLAKINETLKT